MPKIVPKEKVTTTVIGGFEIQNVELKLFNSARIVLRLLNEDGNMMDLAFVTMDGEDYKKWGVDDNYIIEFAANKLGFVVEPPVVETEVVEAPVEAPVEVPVEAPVEVVEAPVEPPV